MDWKTTAIVFILTVLAGIVCFFVANSSGYIKWSLNPSDLTCEDCSLSCYLDECNSTEIAEVADTDEIKALICDVCETCETCGNCSLSGCSATETVTLCNQSIVISTLCEEFDLLGTDLNLTFDYYNETGSLITSGDAEFLGEGEYNISIENKSLIIEVGQ